jgi:hypothetical protein
VTGALADRQIEVLGQVDDATLSSAFDVAVNARLAAELGIGNPTLRA